MDRMIFDGNHLRIESIDILEEWKKFTVIQNDLLQGRLNYLDIEYDLEGTISRYLINVFTICNGKVKEYNASYSGQHKTYQLYGMASSIEACSLFGKKYFLDEISLVSRAIKSVFLFPEGKYLNYHFLYDGYVKLGIQRDMYYHVQEGKWVLLDKSALPIEGYGFKVYGMIKTGTKSASSDHATWFMF